jgi:hypothetical protein
MSGSFAHLYIIDGRLLDRSLVLDIRHSDCGDAVMRLDARKRVELLSSFERLWHLGKR